MKMRQSVPNEAKSGFVPDDVSGLQAEIMVNPATFEINCFLYPHCRAQTPSPHL